MKAKLALLNRGSTLLLLGIGGQAMRALAHILQSKGINIIGVDAQYERVSNDSTMIPYKIIEPLSIQSTLSQVDAVIYSDALPITHPWRQAAQEVACTQLSAFETAGLVTQDYKTIAVAGTHGKSSTTALLGHIMVMAGLDPTVQVGAAVPAWENRNARVGSSEYFIIEADEYMDHFMALKPADIIITSLDFDHPDYFRSFDDVLASFGNFLERLVPNGTVVTHKSLYMAFKDRLPWPKKTLLVDLSAEKLPLSLPGKHMQQNAHLAIAMAGILGVSRTIAQEATGTFPGLGRRFELLGEFMGRKIFSDYAHHPTEIAATLQAAREYFPHKKLLVVFEPHTNERLGAFFSQYIQALSASDAIIVCPTYQARGQVNDTHTDTQLLESLQQRKIQSWYLRDFSELNSLLQEAVKNFDIVFGLTAGDLDYYLRKLINGLKFKT